MKRPSLSLAIALLLLARVQAAPEPLFDGRTFQGWQGNTEKTWRIEDGVILGGSLEGNPRNEFLATRQRFKNFILRLEYKLAGTEGFVNGGVQFRSQRSDDPPNEMIGYQADIGAGYSGHLYDESRRKRMLAEPDKALIQRLEKPGDWNALEIRAEDQRVQIRLNGTRTVDYTEREPGIPLNGRIALQIHGNCKAVIGFRNITLEPLPDVMAPEGDQVLERFGEPGLETSTPAPFANGRFVPQPNEVMVFTGQENLVREQKAGELEALLAHGFAGKQPRFRSMAWEGDTVYEQWRDLNFGDWKAQLDAAGAGIVIAQFGQIEALDGKARLAEFASAYHRLLDQFTARTPRLVLLSPMPFQPHALPHAPDLTQRNEDVQAYAEAVRQIARQRGALFVDLFSALQNDPQADLTDNGLHLNAKGLRHVARLIARELGVSSSESDDLNPLREAIVEKNRLWFDCWRPANWSFVYGDRVTQLFGKPAEDYPSLRESFESHKSLIAWHDELIHTTANGRPFTTAKPVVARAPEPAPEPVLTPGQQLAAFTVAEGYEVNLFASEALGVAKPVQFAWDEKGRLWVACSPTYPHTLPGVKPSDFILVLEDTDHDGVADKSSRFAEGLTMVQGVEPSANGAYVCDFDRLIHLIDNNGDGQADETRVLFSGFGIGDTHQLANSISHGPDGALWFTQGLHAFSRVETPHGLAILEKAGLWRLDPRTLKLESYFNGGKAGHNCWGVAFDDYLQVFHKSGDRPAGYFSTPGLIPLRDPDEYHPTGALFDTNPKTTALDIIGSSALPDEIQGCALIGGYFGGVVELHRFEDAGSGFKTTQLPRLLTSSDASFRPVDVSVGPDGAIYLCDWFNPVIGHYQASYADPRRDRVHGRIWRVSAKGRAPVRQPELASMKTAQLLEQLRSPERWTRYQAKRLLFQRATADSIDAVDAFIARETDERVLMEVCGLYEAWKTPRPELLNRLFAAQDGRLRAYAARMLGLWQSCLPDAPALLAKAVHDEHPRARLEAVVASARLPKPETVTLTTQVLDHPVDPFLDYALRQAVKALQPHWQPALARLQFTNAAQAELVKSIANAAPETAHPGKVIYDALCLNCHQPEGKGLPGIYPGVAASDWVNGDTERLIRIVLHGLSGPIQVNGQLFTQAAPLPMPPMGLDDQQTADVLTWLRQNFGNDAAPVTADEVQKVRAAHSDRATFWTEAELQRP